MNWVLGPFVHGRLQNLQTNEVTFAHVVTPLKLNDLYCKIHNFLSLYSFTEGLREGMFVSQTTWFTVKFDVAKRIVLTWVHCGYKYKEFQRTYCCLFFQDLEEPGAYIKIITQPQDFGYRFRYEIEGKAHGGIQGQDTGKTRNEKKYPTIQVDFTHWLTPITTCNPSSLTYPNMRKSNGEWLHHNRSSVAFISAVSKEDFQCVQSVVRYTGTGMFIVPDTKHVSMR